jgi:hypothetical protein
MCTEIQISRVKTLGAREKRPEEEQEHKSFLNLVSYDVGENQVARRTRGYHRPGLYSCDAGKNKLGMYKKSSNMVKAL